MAKPVKQVKVEETVCPSCKTPPYPRGYDVRTGKCWFCIFPRG